MTNDTASSVNPWDKARAISTIVATAIIPLAVALAGNWYAQAIKDKEIQLKYIELSIQILSAPPTDQNMEVRRWAVEAINRYSEVKINAKAEKELLSEQLRLMIRSNEEAKKIIEEIGR